MTAATFGVAYSLVWFCFAVPTAVFLLRSYVRSKMSGFMWLLVALVAWPLLAQGARMGLPMMAASGGYGIKPVLMMDLGLGVISGILVLVAVIVLDRELAQRLVAAQPVMPVQAQMPPPAPTVWP